MTNINDLAEEYVFANTRLKEERRDRLFENGVLLLICLLFVVGISVYLWLNRMPNFSLLNFENYLSDMLKQFWPAFLADLASFLIGAQAVGKLTHPTNVENKLKKVRNAAKDRAKVITPKKEMEILLERCLPLST
ncbi:hypothetical protein NXS13_07825 [Corynebacterium sp. ES2730-CONJ]|uniref:hypothetical protein n=1 Tax=Corynebacterium sp. ES2730-CONJ TaxID=2973941 RepID=UPI00216B21A0|nr:hypothetical protein [Corynebacterium sp. ES2730-CONJ]MCS4532407.1 hypothetical protein [Corynebacterium sp. ES2730-CONJ]